MSTWFLYDTCNDSWRDENKRTEMNGSRMEMEGRLGSRQREIIKKETRKVGRIFCVCELLYGIELRRKESKVYMSTTTTNDVVSRVLTLWSCPWISDSSEREKWKEGKLHTRKISIERMRREDTKWKRARGGEKLVELWGKFLLRLFFLFMRWFFYSYFHAHTKVSFLGGEGGNELK